MSRLARPLAWFQLSTAYAAVVWFLFVFDLRLIRGRLREAATPEETALFTAAKADQWLNITALIPLLFVFNLISACLIRRWPGFFIDRDGHVWLIAAQLVSFLVYLVYVTRFFSRLAPEILRTEMRRTRAS